MEKTIKEWFESVADPELRRQLLENYDHEFIGDPERKCGSLYNAIDYGFAWSQAKHGNIDYWHQIATDAINGKIPMIDEWPRELTPQEQADSDRAAEAAFRACAKEVSTREVDKAIKLLKSIGYRIQKPVTTYEEV